jgi:IS30 family transposase
VGIEHCPEIGDLKTEIGHWESDTMIGCNPRGILVIVILDRDEPIKK